MLICSVLKKSRRGLCQVAIKNEKDNPLRKGPEKTINKNSNNLDAYMCRNWNMKKDGRTPDPIKTKKKRQYEFI